ncbi:MAG: 2-phospho-L-lactate guanylyltransferase [Frankiaceae bacterium]|nr:2-phospho-L-lactate guanylyltransferase [Frankiaceae bacterium]MBV9869374.1 2-phospho-L-lactate guanylyltransferase [Frankiaceae bacterium]
MSGDGDLWSVLVPVKRLSRAKTRLAVPEAIRAELALAMAIDTVCAVLATPAVAEVVVITDDDRAAPALEALGARIVADVPDAGLNPALRYGAGVAAGTRIAALSADLPALRTSDLDAILRLAASYRRSIVADHSGVGTTMLAARGLTDFQPSFGADSRAAHVRGGATDLTEDAGPTLRHDVDTVEGLDSARALGLGSATDRVLATAPKP